MTRGILRRGVVATVVVGMVAASYVVGQRGVFGMRFAGPQAPEARRAAEARRQQEDWAQLRRYHADNQRLLAEPASPRRVIFFGDSITDSWGRQINSGRFFPGKPYVNRGISGQTTPQMLVRFEQDVVRLRPAAVVILAGTNDFAGNTGPETPEMIEDNLRAMTVLAKAGGIRVVLASILPTDHYRWRPEVQPAEQIRQMNVWLQSLAAADGMVYLDYYSALVNERGGMREGTSKDGVHPNTAGYAVMAPLAESAISQALAR